MTQPAEINIEHEAIKQPQVGEYIDAFSREAINPPNKDKCMGAFYTALTDLAQSDDKGIINSFLQHVVYQRQREFTPQHLTNLIFRVFQYVKLFKEKDYRYPLSHNEPNRWKIEIPNLLEKHGKLMTELLLTKDTTTTIYQRYAGTQAVLNGFFPDQKLKVADFGCGGNYGLPGLIKGIPFKVISDETPDQILSMLINHQLDIGEGLAIDKIDPQDPDEKAWRLACSFYPQELNQLADLMVFEAGIANVHNVKFLQADLLDLHVDHFNNGGDTLPEKYFNAVVMNTICYQLNPQEQKRVFEIARRSIKKGGLLIVQDFARKDSIIPERLQFLESWFAEKDPYRTYVCGESTNWMFKEFLRWSSGRCLEVRTGEDFKELLNNNLNFAK